MWSSQSRIILSLVQDLLWAVLEENIQPENGLLVVREAAGMYGGQCVSPPRAASIYFLYWHNVLPVELTLPWNPTRFHNLHLCHSLKQEPWRAVKIHQKMLILEQGC